MKNEATPYEVGTELIVNGQWAIVTAIVDDTAFVCDQDGEEFELTEENNF